ncbi:MAG: hypothetical protein ACK5M4_16100 [Pseudorhodobacter sp.]
MSMKTPLVTAIAMVLILGGCGFGSSRLNPFNWFGGSTEVETVASEEEGPQDNRLLVQQVTQMEVDRNQTGAIIRATGLPPTQGYWEAELVPRPVDENGELVFDFRVFPPVTPQAVSTQQSREITAGAFLSNIKLRDIRRITVQGESNARSSSRR